MSIRGVVAMRLSRASAVVALAVACALAFTAGNAASFQKRTGVVVGPVPERAFGIYVEGCPGIVNAMTWWLAGTSYSPRFAVDSGTWGRPFTLKGFLQKSNLDISFRVAGGWIAHSAKGLTPETGSVPWGASEAVVCLRAGVPTRFLYVAG